MSPGGWWFFYQGGHAAAAWGKSPVFRVEADHFISWVFFYSTFEDDVTGSGRRGCRWKNLSFS
jgi:hypothetical protein